MSATPWAYEQRPDTRTTTVRMGMWLFLASEAMFFGSLFSAYVLLREGSATWPDGREVLGLKMPVLNTVVMLALTLAVAGRRMLIATALGIAFVVMAVADYYVKLNAGLQPSMNLMLACWFTLGAVHTLHVAGGVVANLWVARGAATSSPLQLAERLRAVALYWYFLGVVWLVLLVGFYFT